jgi:hypothetical protein
MPKEWGVLEMNACWKWSPGVVILGMPHFPNATHIENPKIKLFTWVENGWDCINKYYPLSNIIFSHQNFQVLVMALIKAARMVVLILFILRKLQCMAPMPCPINWVAKWVFIMLCN